MSADAPRSIAPPPRTTWKRRLLIAVAALLFAYVGSFSVVIQVPQGTRTTADSPAATSGHVPVYIYASHSNLTINRLAKIVYRPLIRLGEVCGDWNYIDDPRGGLGGPTLLQWLLRWPPR